MGIVVVIIVVLAIVGWVYNEVSKENVKEEAKSELKDLADSYCEFYETSPAFGTSKLGADNVIAYIIKENDVKAAALKGKAVMFKDTVKTVEYNYTSYYGGEVPTIVFGNRQYVSSDFNKKYLKHEIRAYFDPEDARSCAECSKVQQGETVLLFGIFHLDNYNRPTELVETQIVRRNGHLASYLHDLENGG